MERMRLVQIYKKKSSSSFFFQSALSMKKKKVLWIPLPLNYFALSGNFSFRLKLNLKKIVQYPLFLSCNFTEKMV